MGAATFWCRGRGAALFSALGCQLGPATGCSTGCDAAQPALLLHPWRDSLFTSTYPNHRSADAFGFGTLIFMRIAQRYLATEIYRSSAIVLLALMGLFTFFNLIDELDRLSSTFSVANLLYLEALSMPTQLYELLPIGLLIGSILALAGLAQRNELVILRVSGISGLRLLFMLWVATIPLMLLAMLLSEYIAPRTEIRANEASLEIIGRAGGGRLSSGYWFRERADDGAFRIINIRRLHAQGRVENVTVYLLDQALNLQSLTQATEGVLKNQQLQLEQSTTTHIHPEAVHFLEHTTAPQEPLIKIETDPSTVLPTALTSERLLARILTPERMAAADLLDYISYLEDNQLQTTRQVVALWRKFAYPFSLLVMITIAAPISFMQTRRGGAGSKIFLGIVVGVGFFMLNQLTLNLGMLSQWSPWVTALLPNLSMLITAFIALLILENRNRRFLRARRPN